jgi:O-antigen ligase
VIIQKLTEFPLGKIGIVGFVFFMPVSIAISQLCIGIAIAGWLLLMIREKSFLWKKTPLDFPIFIYLLSQIIAVLLSQNIGEGLGAWLNTDWFILFYYATINLIDSEEDFKHILIIFTIAGCISALYGILQHFIGIEFFRNKILSSRGNFYRATGFFNMSLTYGGIQLALFVFLSPFYLIREFGVKKNLMRIILLVLFSSIIASYARSAWLGLGVFIILVLILLRNRYKYYASAFIILIFVLIYFVHPDLLFRQGLFSMFDISENAPYNNLVRLKLWESTWAMFKDNWVFGIGYSDWYHIFTSYKIPFEYRGLNDPHNDLLRVLALSGLTGGLAFLYIWISDLRHKYLSFRSNLGEITLWKAGSLGSFFTVIAYLAAGITQEYYHDAEIAGLWWFLVALGMISVMKIKSESFNKKNI